jgi:uncharacterized membrane-anchored protein
MTKWLICFLCLFSVNISAQENIEEAEAPNVSMWEEVMAQSFRGPAQVPLSTQAELILSEEYIFIPAEPASVVMRSWGNSVDESFQGMILPADPEAGQWFGALDFIKSGYIKDDDAKDWDAEELLDSIKSGTQQQNKERAKLGIPAMEIVGWVQKPLYSAEHHQLVYSIASRDVGAAASVDQGINYNTYVLGREGYLQLNLVTDLSMFPEDKQHAEALLSAMTFVDGKRYAQFNPDTDYVAEYGLAALVAGVAAKKLGFLALIGVFLLKGWKIILIGLIAVGAIFKKFRGDRIEKP